MKTIQPNCRVRLRFPEEEVEYIVRRPDVRGIGLSEISTEAPLGRKLLGQKEGAEITLDVISGHRVWCRVVKIYKPVYTAH